jgi:hypothetical protein
VAYVPDDVGVDSLARQIRMTGRAYPLFEIAQMILARPERHGVTVSVKKGPEGQVLQPLFVCAVDETPWLGEEEAVQHLLTKHFNLFYQPERTQIEPPKGTYTFVAQCGMSGVILGPPNYHDYQNHLRKLHAERFARMPFEVFKSRVKIVRDEAVVKQWLDEQSWRTEYICLNVPEPLKLGNRGEVEKHFREVHLPNVVKQVETCHLTGTAARNVRSSGLTRLLRHTWQEQRRFPLQIATVLSQQFATRGLQFFKVNRTVTHVAVARPHYLDLEATPVSDGVRRIVDYINANARCTRRQLIEALAPAPAAPVAPQPVAEATPTVEGAPAAPPTAAPAAPTPEQTAIIADLHWLVHQGHVIEFANGTLETAKKPPPRPPKAVPATVPVAEPTQPATALVEPAPTGGALAIATTEPSEPPVEPAAEPALAAVQPPATPPSDSLAPTAGPEPAVVATGEVTESGVRPSEPSAPSQAG